MSSLVASSGAADAPPAASRSYGGALMARVFQRWGAWFGALWVGVLVVFAVFAPFIANTHPLLIKWWVLNKAGVQGYAWDSPLLRFLNVSDVLLLIVAGLAIGFLPLRRFRFSDRVLAVIVPLGCATLAGHWVDGIGPFIGTSLREMPGQFLYVLSYLMSAGKAKAQSSTTPEHGLFVNLAIWLGLLIYLAVLAWAVVGFARRRFTPRSLQASSFIVAAALCLVLVCRPIRPPQTVDYEVYRKAAAARLDDGQPKVRFVIYAPLRFSPDDRLRDQPEKRLTGPSRWAHPLGTTVNGADLLANMIHASRIALSIGFISTGIGIFIGVVIGGLMGYYSGVFDLIGMRLVEIFSAIPTLLLLLCFVAFFGANLYIMMVIIGLTSWEGNAVFIRAEFLKLRQQDFVQAAIAQGLPLRSVLFRHMLPNGVAPLLVNASFEVAGAILSESTLSFLGVGLVNEASWGKLLNDALGSGGTFYWWLAIFPGAAIFLTVFAYNLLGEAMRDAIDPHLQKASQLK